jgi:hypothetical protein
LICDACGVELQVGAWPYCPHGVGKSSIVPDEVPGGFWVENGFETPQKFYSHSAHEAALAARGLEIRAKHTGDSDKHLINWAAGIDAQTLANAAELLTRGTPKVGTNVPDSGTENDAPIPITVTNIHFERPA